MPSGNVGRIISVVKNKSNVVVSFDIFDSLILDFDTYTNDFYYVDKCISKKEYDKLLIEINDKKYLSYACSICLKNSYTKKELVDKLKTKGADIKAIDRIVIKLKDLGLINDNNYVLEFKAYHDSKCDGKIKIIRLLKEKGISDSLINDLTFDYENELEKAKKITPSLILKYKNKSNAKIKESIISSLIRRGFTYDIANICSNLINCDEDEEEKIKKLIIAYENKGYQEDVIFNKLMSKGFKYGLIKKVMKE